LRSPAVGGPLSVGGPVSPRLSRSEALYLQQPPPVPQVGPEVEGAALHRLRDQVRLERGRFGAGEAPTAAASEGIRPPQSPASTMPTRMTVPPLPHVGTEVRRLHVPQFQQLQEQGLGTDGKPRPPPDKHRDGCCYPGSGQVHSLESSGHGDLKRAVIAYARSVLQEQAAGSPLAAYLPTGGLTTQQLVNVTALAAHHFLIRCPLRPHDPVLSPEDKAAVHTVLAHILADLPGQYRGGLVHIASAEEEAVTEPPESPRVQEPAWPPPPREVQESGRPVVVLMRPMLTEDVSVVVYGTVTCPSPVTCKWELRRENVEVPLDDIFQRGLATTEPVSASSFSLRIAPGTLVPGSRYDLTLHVTSDAGRLSSSASQSFDVPRTSSY